MLPMEYYNARHISLFDGILNIELHYCNLEYVLDAWRVTRTQNKCIVITYKSTK